MKEYHHADLQLRYISQVYNDTFTNLCSCIINSQRSSSPSLRSRVDAREVGEECWSEVERGVHGRGIKKLDNVGGSEQTDEVKQ